VKSDVPQGVTAVLANGIRIPCQVLRNGRDISGYPKFRIVAELDWRRHQIVRVEVEYWPDDTSLALDMADATPGECGMYASKIEWVEKGRAAP
jgi:hypothetical protein